MNYIQPFIKTEKLEDGHLSTSSLYFLNTIINKLRETREINASPISGGVPQTSTLKGKMWNHLHPSIQNKINSLTGNKTLYTLNIHAVKIQVYLMGGSREYHNQSIMLISRYLSFIIPYCPPKCLGAFNNDLHIYIYLLSDKKVLPKAGKIIDTINANTAFTHSCSGGGHHANEITIFRKEEWFKVLIHETFHNFGLDFSLMSMEKPNAHLREMFRTLRENDFRIYESYCEIYAELLNILFFVSLKPLTEQRHLLEKCISLEKTFSLYQWNKILKYYGFSYEEFVNGKTDGTLYSEKTSVLSYYGIKSMGLFFLNDFIQTFCLGKNPFYFAKTEKNVEKYCLFFKNRFVNKEYLKSLNQKGVSQHIPTIKNTLRMTLIEII